MSTIYYDYAPPGYIEQVKSTIRLPNKSSLKSIFPIIEWLPKYNLQWFTGDIICAITIGIVTISQAMAYSMIAGLPPQYGLYSTIMGALVYPFIGTSKDISIGTTAINSLLFGQIMFMVKQTSQFQSGEWTLAYVCATLTLLSGIICFAVGFLRLGILFDFICQPAIAGFMGGSGITIIVNQLPKILGITNIDTTQPTYHIFGHTLLGLPKTKWDAIIGISSLIYIYVIRYYMNIATQRYPRYSTYFFYINITRNIVAIIVSTIISYLINHLGHYENSPFKILGVVPAGLQELRVPTFDTSLISLALPNMVGVVVLQIMEHCSIAVSLGKLSDYKVNINQEISSIGISNIFGSFLSSYPFTGAFSRSAVMSKSGSRTPLTNMFIGIIVIITIYFFTPALAYIPVSAICAVVCSGVTDLITGPKVWVKYWNTHPSEFIIFTCAYILSLVTRIDMSVYVPIGVSLVVQLYRMSRPKYAFLGRLDLLDHNHHYQDEKNNTKSTTLDEKINNSTNIKTKTIDVQPIGHGIICFQPRENLLFENVNYVYEALMDEIKRTTRRGKPLSDNIGNRPWNDVTNNSKSEEKPILQSVILDLSGVHVMDYSAMEQLAELTRRVEKYCGSPIPWFVVVGNSELVRHSLLYAGFGRQQR
ncbi:sulfate transporter family-domain-containing protein, partial [Cunninghamella echinulata]